MQTLTEQGYENIQDVFENYVGVKISRKFIDDNYEKLASMFIDADDDFMLETLKEGEEPWWTFEGEANRGSISDTDPRERLLDAFGESLTGKHWPCYGDGPEALTEFQKLLAEAIDAHPEIEVLGE